MTTTTSSTPRNASASPWPGSRAKAPLPTGSPAAASDRVGSGHGCRVASGPRHRDACREQSRPADQDPMPCGGSAAVRWRSARAARLRARDLSEYGINVRRWMERHPRWRLCPFDASGTDGHWAVSQLTESSRALTRRTANSPTPAAPWPTRAAATRSKATTRSRPGPHPAQGDAGRLPPVRSELLPALPSGGEAAACVQRSVWASRKSG